MFATIVFYRLSHTGESATRKAALYQIPLVHRRCVAAIPSGMFCIRMATIMNRLPPIIQAARLHGHLFGLDVFW